MRYWMDEAKSLDGRPHMLFHLAALSGEDRKYLCFLAQSLIESDDMRFLGFAYDPGERGTIHLEVVPFDTSKPLGLSFTPSVLLRAWKRETRCIVLRLLNEDCTRRGVYIPHSIRLVPPDPMEAQLEEVQEEMRRETRGLAPGGDS